MAIGGIGKTLYNGAEKMVQAALEMQEFSKKLLKERIKNKFSYALVFIRGC
jgi:hypothetical protein